jgi:hypothetical protein
MKSIDTYTERWGKEQVFVPFSQRISIRGSREACSSMLAAARRGHQFFVFAPPSVYRMILSASLHTLHDTSSCKLPGFYPFRACRPPLRGSAIPIEIFVC